MNIPTESIPDLSNMTGLATQYATSAWGIANAFLIVIILLGAFFILARYLGRGSFVAFLISLYAAYAPYTLFPYKSMLPSEPAPTAFFAHAGLYLALVILFFIIMKRVIVSDFLFIGNFGLLILSFLASAFLIAIASHTFAIDTIYQFNSSISAIFSPDKYFFWWFSGPALGLLFLAR